MLLACGEHHAVDLRRSLWTSQSCLLIDFRKSRTKAANGPLNRAAGIDHRSLAAEVPGLVVPVLDSHILQMSIFAHDDFDRPKVQTWLAVAGGGQVVNQSGFGVVLKNDQSV